MIDNDKLVAFNNYNTKYLYILSDDVLSKIKAGASSWEEDVPTEVVKAIKFYEKAANKMAQLYDDRSKIK